MNQSVYPAIGALSNLANFFDYDSDVFSRSQIRLESRGANYISDFRAGPKPHPTISQSTSATLNSLVSGTSTYPSVRCMLFSIWSFWAVLFR